MAIYRPFNDAEDRTISALLSGEASQILVRVARTFLAVECCTVAPFLPHRSHQQEKGFQHTSMLPKRERTQSWQGRKAQSFSISTHEAYVGNMSGYSAGSMRPEGIQSGADCEGFKCLISCLCRIKIMPTNILRLAIWTLKGCDQVITRPCDLKPFQVLNFSQ